jgi:predicted MPP superfamily phosphohydrolase
MDIGLIVLVVSILLASYVGMHYYLYRKLRWIFPRQKKIIIISLCLLASSLLIVEAMTHTGFSHFVMPLAWVSSLWTGYVFIFFAFAGMLDIVTKVVSLLDKDNTLIHIKQRTKGILSSGIVLLICIYGFISAQQINILSYTLAATKLQQPITIVQVADLHLGLLSNKAHIQKLVDDINSLKPDIIVSTGDLVDMQLDYLDGFSSILAKLTAKDGKFTVYGNHEAIAGLEKSRAFIERAGFTLLSNNGIKLDHLINIVGIDDPAVYGEFNTSGEQEEKILGEFSPGLFTLLLKHQPVVAPETRGMFDLQLSGHTHGGQIFPFTLLTKFFYHAPFGLSKIGTESWLYVSKGAGTWGPPMRVLAKPEVSVFYLKPKRDD